MLAWILDRNFENLEIVDSYQSFIWTDRFNEAGDFELYLPPKLETLEFLKADNYVMIRESDRLMVIETLSLDASAEGGDMLTVTGRSLESLLDRRVIWGSTRLSGNVQNGIQKLLNENAINPSITKRKIPGLVFRASNDSGVTSKTFSEETELNGENLYDAIQVICMEHNLGFRMLPKYDTKQIIFELYSGADRSYDQEDNPWVVFSPGFGNILSSSYLKDITNYKNACLVLGELNDYYDQVLVDAALDNSSGLDRREMSEDGGDIPATVEYREEVEVEVEDSGGNTHTDVQIVEVHDPNPDQVELMTSKGKEALVEYEQVEAFESEIDPEHQFVLGRDFFMGDIVQVVNDYGLESVARVAEVIRCHDDTGETVTPTFISV